MKIILLIYLITIILPLILVVLEYFLCYRLRSGVLIWNIPDKRDFITGAIMSLVPIINLIVLVIYARDYTEFIRRMRDKSLLSEIIECKSTFKNWDIEKSDGDYKPRYRKLYIIGPPHRTSPIEFTHHHDNGLSFRTPSEAVTFIENVMEHKYNKYSKILKIKDIKQQYNAKICQD